jgi:hypothetical protein
MGTTTITLPNAFTNGTTADGDEVKANDDMIVTAIVTTGLDTGNLINPKALFPITLTIDTLSTGETILHRVKTPAGIRVHFVNCQACADEITDTPTMTVQVYGGSVGVGNEVLTSALSITVADTLAETTGFDRASVNPGTELVFEIIETSGGGADRCDDITVTLWCAALHQT